MSNTAGQYFISKHCIDNGTFSIWGSAKECHFHVISTENISDAMNFIYEFFGFFNFIIVDDLLIILNFCKTMIEVYTSIMKRTNIYIGNRFSYKENFYS